MSKIARPHGARTTRFLVLCVLFAAGGSAAAAQGETEPLVTDRPDVTESAETVAAGRFQLEVGASFERRGDEEVLAVPEALVRLGLARGFELRVEPGAWIETSGPEGLDREDGRDDGSVGVKMALGDGAALIVDTAVPTGEAAVNAGDAWQPGALLALAWNLPAWAGLPWSLGANAGVRSAVEDGERFEAFTWSLALGTELGRGWGAFAELFGTSREEPDGSARAAADAGLTRLVTPDFQLDAAIGVGLDGEDTDWFATVGVAWRR